MNARIQAKLAALAEEKTPDGDDVRSHLGAPLGGEENFASKGGQGTQLLFQRGMIVDRSDGRTFAVYGAIFDRYVQEGGPGGHLGPPIAEEDDAAPGGRVSRFDAGDIYWRADKGARMVSGALRSFYVSGRDPFASSWLNRAVRIISVCTAKF